MSDPDFSTYRGQHYGHVHAARELTRTMCLKYGNDAYRKLREMQKIAATSGDYFAVETCRVAENFMIAQIPREHWPVGD